MDSIAGLIGDDLTTVIRSIVAFLIVLTVIVFVHELGHFLAARWVGIGVRVFSIGFGPEIAGFYDRRGTRWRFSAIPLGGYVKFVGDENEASQQSSEALDRLSEEERKKAFGNKGVGARSFVVAAGPAANFILAIIIFTAMFSLYGRQVTIPRVDEVVVDSAAEAAGFLPGDIIVSIDGQEIENFIELQRVVSVSSDIPLTFVVLRDDEQVTLVATPERKETEDPFGNKVSAGILGIRHQGSAEDVVVERFSLPGATVLAVSETWYVVERTFIFIGDLFVGRESVDQLGGPIRIAEISGQAASISVAVLVQIAATLSISIGLINLFPIPMLDGGHLVFYAIEAIRRRPLSEKAQDIGFRIGFTLIVMLMIFVTWNDTSRWF